MESPNFMETSVSLRGTFTFRLKDPDGSVVEQRELNSLVDVGRLQILRVLGDLPEEQTGITFSGDGSTTVFNLNPPYYPVYSISNVTVDGNAQTEHTDFSVDYWNGEIHFDAAPSDSTDNISADVKHIQYPFRWLAVGTDGSAIQDSQDGLLSESERVELDPNTNSGEYSLDTGAVDLTGTWLFAGNQANVTIAEAGLFGMAGSEANADSSEDDMLNRTVVDPAIDKSSGQELEVVWTLSMG